MHFDRDMFSEALTNLEMLISKYPKSDAAPEAIFFRGVAKYKATHDAKPLKQAYELLETNFPGAEWTKRAYPIGCSPNGLTRNKIYIKALRFGRVD